MRRCRRDPSLSSPGQREARQDKRKQCTRKHEAQHACHPQLQCRPKSPKNSSTCHQKGDRITLSRHRRSTLRASRWCGKKSISHRKMSRAPRACNAPVSCSARALPSKQCHRSTLQPPPHAYPATVRTHIWRVSRSRRSEGYLMKPDRPCHACTSEGWA